MIAESVKRFSFRCVVTRSLSAYYNCVIQLSRFPGSPGSPGSPIYIERERDGTPGSPGSPFMYSVGHSFVFFWYLLALHKCKLLNVPHGTFAFMQSGNRAIGQSVCCGGIAASTASTGIRIQRAIGKVCCGGIAGSTGSTGSVAPSCSRFNGFKIVKDS